MGDSILKKSQVDNYFTNSFTRIIISTQNNCYLRVLCNRCLPGTRTPSLVYGPLLPKISGNWIFARHSPETNLGGIWWTRSLTRSFRSIYTTRKDHAFKRHFPFYNNIYTAILRITSSGHWVTFHLIVLTRLGIALKKGGKLPCPKYGESSVNLSGWTTYLQNKFLQSYWSCRRIYLFTTNQNKIAFPDLSSINEPLCRSILNLGQ